MHVTFWTRRFGSHVSLALNLYNVVAPCKIQLLYICIAGSNNSIFPFFSILFYFVQFSRCRYLATIHTDFCVKKLECSYPNNIINIAFPLLTRRSRGVYIYKHIRTLARLWKGSIHGLSKHSIFIRQYIHAGNVKKYSYNTFLTTHPYGLDS